VTTDPSQCALNIRRCFGDYIARCEAVNCRLLVVEANERSWFDARRHARAVAVAAVEGGASGAAI
jgi:hypothetical protein